MLNISSSNRTKLNVFEEILNNGPSTAYSVGKNLEMAQSTALRTIRVLEKFSDIIIYEKIEIKGRTRILFGPTLKGIFAYYNMIAPTDKKLEKIWNRWIKDAHFKIQAKGSYSKELLQIDPDKVSKLFVKQIKFYAEMLREYDEFIEKNGVPIELMFQVGSLQIEQKHPERFNQTVQELVDNVPGFREGVKKQVEEFNAEKEEMSKFMRESE